MKILDFFKKGFVLLLIFFVFSGFSVNNLFSGSSVSKEDINKAISIMNEKKISHIVKPGTSWHKIDVSKCKYLQFNKTVDKKEKVQAVYCENGNFVIVRKDRKLENVIQLYYILDAYGDGNIPVDDKYIDFTNSYFDGFLVNLKYKTARTIAGYVYPDNNIEGSIKDTTDWIASICFGQKKVEYSLM